jgi:hemerythrin-like domain-containing protein
MMPRPRRGVRLPGVRSVGCAYLAGSTPIFEEGFKPVDSSDGGPADTAMMGIVHSALRRDLTRTATALSTQPPPGEAQRAALTAHLAWMMDFLHRHHEGEDAGLWPLVRSLDPSAGDLLDQMEQDHAQIAPQMDGLSAATRRYSDDAANEARDGVVEALASLRAVLDPHLHREEAEMMPVVSRTLTKAQWEDFNQEHYIKPKSKSELGQEGHWLIDSIDPAGYKIVVGNVPPISRFILLHAFAGRYARVCAARWGSTVSIKPLPS